MVTDPEHALLWVGLRLLAVVGLVAAVVAGLVRGTAGALTATGSVLALGGWLAASALPAAWAARHSPGVLAGVQLGGYVVRIAALGGLAVAASAVPGTDETVLAVTFGVGLVVLLAGEAGYVLRHRPLWWLVLSPDQTAAAQPDRTALDRDTERA